MTLPTDWVDHTDPEAEPPENAIYNAAAANAVATQVNENTTALGGLSLWTGTQAAYDAITTPDPDTVYIVTT